MRIDILDFDVDWDNLAFAQRDEIIIRAMERYGMNPGWHEKYVSQLANAWQEHIAYEMRAAALGVGEDESPAKAWHALHQLNKCCEEIGLPEYAGVAYGDGMAALEVAHAMVMEAWEHR